MPIRRTGGIKKGNRNRKREKGLPMNYVNAHFGEIIKTHESLGFRWNPSNRTTRNSIEMTQKVSYRGDHIVKIRINSKGEKIATSVKSAAPFLKVGTEPVKDLELKKKIIEIAFEGRGG
ncbi:MAG: hypothetical protein ABIE23_02500 [archaeon]